MHVIKLDGYNATVDNGEKLELGTFGSYGEEQLQIVKAPDWGNLSVIATFNSPNKKSVQVVVDSVTGVIKVPKEATADLYGVGTIVFVGLADGVQRISADVEYIVRKHSNASGTEPAEPTPDVVQQILSAANGAVKTADGVREDMNKVLEAESGRETAEANRAAAESARVEAETARVDAEAYRAAAEKERQTAESARLAAENDRQSAETTRAKAETARESAETDRATAEVARVKAEEERADYEKLRKDHETQRVTDETVRQTAESKRKEAETARADAESKRADAEQARVKAESTRVAAETTRKDAESKRDNSEQERQTAEKGRVAAEAKRTEDFAKIKESLDGISKIDDTAITTTSPWSSKQIVDTLCPPIEETGNPVVCYPVAGYPLGVKAKWEPVQEGSGTPSPENIRPIKGRDSVTVERCGENLLDIAQCRTSSPSAAYGLTVTVDDTGLIRVFGTPTVNKDRPDAVFRILFTDQVILTKEYKAKLFVFKGVANSIDLIKSDKSIVLQAPLSPNTPVDIQFRFMYYYTGTTAPATYTPYIGQANTLTLPATVYGGEVDAVTGNGKRTWGIIDNYAGETIPREWISDRDVYSADKNPTVGAQVAYRLAEPVPFTATGAQPIPALSGTNTLLTDADSVSVSGRADLIRIVRKMQEK